MNGGCAPHGMMTQADLAAGQGTSVSCLALPSKAQNLGATTYELFSAATPCNLLGSLHFFADNTGSGGANDANILLGGYLTDPSRRAGSRAGTRP